jgi:antitoxin VapB
MGTPARKARHTLPDGSAAIVEGKLFQTGRSQALRIPAAFRFSGDTVYMKKWRGTVVLLPKDDPWRSLIESVGQFPDDFLSDWSRPAEPQERPGLAGLFD